MNDQPATSTMLDALAGAAVRMFRPLVRILLRHNVSYKTCAEWLRWCYADVAYNEFGLPGRKQSKSRVAVLTGLTRIDVNHLLGQPAPDQVHQQEQYHRGTLVLTGWLADPRFRRDGGPIRRLPFEAPDDQPSFSRLVSLHSGGAPARAVLDELERNGAVEVRADRSVELKRTRFISRASDDDINTAEIVGLSCGRLLETIDHNWRPDRDETRLQLLVYNREIHPDLVPEALAEIEDAARELVDRTDETLYRYEARSEALGTDDQPRCEIGLGVYSFK